MRYIRLGVKAAHDARIALRTHLGEDSDVYEVNVETGDINIQLSTNEMQKKAD